MKKPLMIFALWFVFISSLEVSCTYKRVKQTIIWKGLLRVALDYYSILKYKTKEQPISILKHYKYETRTNHKNKVK